MPFNNNIFLILFKVDNVFALLSAIIKRKYFLNGTYFMINNY